MKIQNNQDVGLMKSEPKKKDILSKLEAYSDPYDLNYRSMILDERVELLTTFMSPFATFMRLANIFCYGP